MPFGISRGRDRNTILLPILLAIGTSGIVPCIDAPCIDAADLKLLFLGDRGHHRPADRFEQIKPVLQARNIEVTYSEDPNDLNPERLTGFHGLIVYANIDSISDSQLKALLDYVNSGRGFIPIHCASFCFRNAAEYVELVGAQFQRHGTGTFRVAPHEHSHPITKGYSGFESWDETYVHTKHNERDRTVLEYRVEGGQSEPWTWIRNQGKGRVFYTAWGHDQRTWGNRGFQNLLERGIRWACGQDLASVPEFRDRPEMTTLRKDVEPFQFVDANVPYYPAGKAWGTIETGKRQMQMPLSPHESLKHFVTPVGFEVELFVSEPDLQGKPLAMAWDERGRLWVCETYDYPNELQTEGQGRDRIRICEDTDGDGRADKFIVFAEKLSIPTSIAFYRGGAIVQDGPQTLFLKDRDGDGRADLRKTLIKGWALRDTHGGVSNFQYGLDNWYYAMQGYNNSEPILTDGRKLTSFRMGFFRFRLTGEDEGTAVTELEFLRSTNNNTWGLGISEEGLIFGSTANGNPSEFMAIANRYYESVRGWSASALNGIADSNQFEPITAKVRQVDHHGGFTAGAGHALYTARNYPAEYWNRTAFVAEPTGHLCATFVLRPDGAGFRARNSWNLVASDDEWSSPIMAEVGPDGNVWFIDWYNFIVQHNPTPAGFSTGKGNAYESELRDKKHGRIYRLVYRGPGGGPSGGHSGAAPHHKSVSLDPNGSVQSLVPHLTSTNLFWRRQAQRLIVERNDVRCAPELRRLVADSSIDEIGLNAGAIHALHTLRALKLPDGGESLTQDVVRSALQHASPGVKRAALQTLSRDESGLKSILDARRHLDLDPQVRLAALLAIAEMPPSPLAGPALVATLYDPVVTNDRWLLDAATSAAARHDVYFLRHFLSGETSDVPPRSDRTSDGKMLERIQIVAEHLARGGEIEVSMSLINRLPRAQANLADAIIRGMSKGWPRGARRQTSAETDEVWVTLLKTLPPSSQGALVSLANRLGSPALDAHATEIARGFQGIVQDVRQSDANRVAAAKNLVTFRPADADVLSLLAKEFNVRNSNEFAQGLVDAIGLSNAPAGGQTLIDAIPGLTPTVRAAGLRAILGRADWTKSLVDAIESGKVFVSDLTLDQRQALAVHPDRDIVRRMRPLLTKGGGLPNPDRQKVIDELLPVVAPAGNVPAGNVAAGKEVFTKTCSKCHTRGGEGTRIGPDLTGMAVHPKSELLIHIIDPSRSVEGNFRIYTVVTDDGRILNGLLASESKSAIEIIDAEAKRHVVLRENIDELVSSTKSLMPDGVEKQHSAEEIRNLLEFLTQRGRFVPIPLERFATAVSTKGLFYDEKSEAERLIFRDWNTKTFQDVPFTLVDPQGDRQPNVILLHGPQGKLPPRMPRQVTLPCNTPAKFIHFLSGVSGWGYPASTVGTVSLIVRLRYSDGATEDHELKNGEHFADYIRRVDVPGSKFAFPLRGQQMRYISVQPKRSDPILEIDLVKGPDATAPVVMAVTIETDVR